MKTITLILIFLAATFTASAQLTVVASNDTCVKYGTSLSISAQESDGTAPYVFMWTPTKGLGCYNCQTPMAYITETITYTITVTDMNGNVGVDSVTLWLIANVDAGLDTLIPGGDTIQIGGSPTAWGGSPGYTYMWTPSGSLDNSTLANPLAFPSVLTTYTVTVIDIVGCTGTDTISVDVFVIGFEELGKQEICFEFYPNPIKKGDPLNIIFNDPQSGHVKLMNVFGQSVNEWAVKKGQASIITNYLDLLTGVYLIKYQSDGQLITKKLIIN